MHQHAGIMWSVGDLFGTGGDPATVPLAKQRLRDLTTELHLLFPSHRIENVNNTTTTASHCGKTKAAHCMGA
jgi:hypothetical protein